MPAHRQTRSINQIKILQVCLQKLILNGFVVCVEDSWIPLAKNKYILLSPNICASENISNLKSALDVLILLQKTIEAISTENKVHTTWNYLGQAQDKERYFNYLEQIFWQNQNEESLLWHPRYQEVVEKSFKLFAISPDLQFPVALASDFFGEKSLQFSQNLSSSLTFWELDPFLLVDELGSLQWKISVAQLIEIQGIVYQLSGKLWHRFEFTTLTTG